MTTVLSIKSKDGIILASDSQGTSSKIKTPIKKIFKINTHVGIGASGDSSQIELFVDELKQSFQNEIKLESEFKMQMYGFMVNLHRFYNYNHSFLCGYTGARLFFTPLSIAAVILRNGDSCIYRMGFGTIGKNNEVSPYMYKVNHDYASIGSGSSYARLVLTQQDRLYSVINKKLSDLTVEHNAGVAAYVINEVKQLDLETGGKIQIAIINRDGYKELSSEEQFKHYEAMTANLYSLLKENFSIKDKATKIFECLFPYE
jgi:20S proteasome alpha/beta subunit